MACYSQNNFKGHMCGSCPPCSTLRSCCNTTDPSGNLWEDICDNTLIQYKKRANVREEREARVYEKMNGISAGKKHKFVTVSLPPDKNYDVAGVPAKLMEARFDYLHNAMFCLEVTGEEMQWHPHLHILILGHPDNTRMIRDLSKLFKVQQNFIDIGFRNPKLYAKRYDYVQGIKRDIKMEQVKNDIAYLESQDLEKYYQHI